ncbi:MAG: Rv3235 family protein [Actinomycetaceae bacterium]|nr:Rv3235 family protein [Actinomycetaceae bacterium]
MSTVHVMRTPFDTGHPREMKSAAHQLPTRHMHTNRWKQIDVSWDYSTQPEPLCAAIDDLPDPAQWGRAVALATVEALRGSRSIFQLQRWLAPELFEALHRRIALNTRLDGKAKPTASPIARSSRACLVSDTVAETTHVISVSGRSRGVCVRLEACRKQWLVTAIEIA